MSLRDDCRGGGAAAPGAASRRAEGGGAASREVTSPDAPPSSTRSRPARTRVGTSEAAVVDSLSLQIDPHL